MAKKNKIKNWVIPGVVGGVVIILTVASIVSGSIQQKKEKESNAASVSVDRIKLKDDSAQAQQMSNTETEVEIEFEDCAVPVGTQLKMTALVVPENTDQALIWSSSDSSVAEIDKDGILTVKAVGTTVVTATVGTVSDSVVIEGIENVAQGSKNNLPVQPLQKIMHPEAAVHRAVRHPVEHPQEAALAAAVQVQAAGRQAVHGQAQAVREAVPMTAVPVIRIRMAGMIQAVRTAVRETPVVLQMVDPARRAVLPAVIPAITTVHPQTAGIPQTTVIAAVTPAMVTTAAAFQMDFQESDLHSVIPMFMYAKKMIHIMEKSLHSRM